MEGRRRNKKKKNGLELAFKLGSVVPGLTLTVAVKSKAIRYGSEQIENLSFFHVACLSLLPLLSPSLFSRVAILCLEMTNRSFATDK